jgi:hypothetical protein
MQAGVVVSELTEEQRKLIDELAGSISKLCHTVIARRLGQFFEVIGEELSKSAPEQKPCNGNEPNPYPQHVKEAAYKLDPECWISYSGKSRAFKRQMELRRLQSLKAASQSAVTP